LVVVWSHDWLENSLVYPHSSVIGPLFVCKYYSISLYTGNYNISI
jgi:hypothetical protein